MALTNSLVTEQHSYVTLNRAFDARKGIVNCWLRRNLNGEALSRSRRRSPTTTRRFGSKADFGAPTAKSHGQGKRGKLSGAAPVVRPLDAKRKNRIPNHEKIVITHTTLDSVMQLPGAFQ